MASTRCPADPCDMMKAGNPMKDKKMTDTERLDKLEQEVNVLRTDFDRMKWEQAVAEMAIGRAIIRGTASFGQAGFNTMGQGPVNCGDLKKNPEIMENPQKKYQPAGSPQLPMKKAADGKEKNEKPECGYFTLG